MRRRSRLLILLILLAFSSPLTLTAAGPNPGLGPAPSTLDRSSPSSTWDALFELGSRGDFTLAAHLLDLSDVPQDQQRPVGEEVAGKLYKVLKTLAAHPGALRSTSLQTGPLMAFRFQKARIEGEVWIRTAPDSQGGPVWLISAGTVAQASFWYRVLILGERPESISPLNAGLGTPPPSVHRGSPRMALSGFQEAARQGNFALAAHYLDLCGVTASRQQEEGARLARRIFLVMLRKAWVLPETVSNAEFGAPEDGVPDDQERLASIPLQRQSVPILLERRFDPRTGTCWTFSPSTVEQIDSLYAAHGYGWIGDHLPTPFFSLDFAGLQLWQWCSLLLVLAVGWFAGRILGRLIVGILGSIAARTRVQWDDDLVKTLDGPLSVVLWGFAVSLGAPLVGLSPGAQAITAKGWQLLTLGGLGWLLFRIVDSLALYLRHVAGEGNPLGVSFLPILQRFSKVIVFTFVLLGALSSIGVQVVGLLAGLGIGGLAVAFAAQKTLENLFGAVAIAGDRPFKVGDYVTIEEVTGTVEDVGLRSTRLRTLQRTLVTLPNAMVVGAKIINFGARDRILFNPIISLSYQATPAQLTLIVDELKRALLSHPKTTPESLRVRFAGFTPSGFSVEIFCWILTTDFHHFTSVAEELNFRIVSIVHEAGASFGVPSQAVALDRASSPDREAARRASEEVARRRAAGDLTIPEPSAEMLDQLRD